MIVADTGAILALIDKNDRHHASLRALYDKRPEEWVLPWAILPEVDYLLAAELGARAQEAFLADIADGSFRLEHSRDQDLIRANQIGRKYRALRLGLVDGVVMAIAERLRAAAIATLDLRHFTAVPLAGAPRLIPRDLE
jgi:predicted nucleic acid-binding protein